MTTLGYAVIALFKLAFMHPNEFAKGKRKRVIKRELEEKGMLTEG